jgi:hypothetical protein
VDVQDAVITNVVAIHIDKVIVVSILADKIIVELVTSTLVNQFTINVEVMDMAGMDAEVMVCGSLNSQFHSLKEFFLAIDNDF